MKTILLAVVLLFSNAAQSQSADEYFNSFDPENLLYLATKYGWVMIEMRPDIAPLHVARIKELVRSGHYKGSTFHRVIKGFIAQTGDPSGRNLGTGQTIPAEFSDEEHIAGTVSMARYEDINSADDQFFICMRDSPQLDGKYTIWGKVVIGMERVYRIKSGNPRTGQVTDPDKVLDMIIASDVKVKKE